MLRWSYKSLEIVLEKTNAKPGAASVAIDAPGYASSSINDDQPSPPNQAKWKKKWKPTPKPPVTVVSANDPVTSVHHTSRCESDTAGVELNQPIPATETDLGEAQAAKRGPRWASPVEGHTDHTLKRCQEFWGVTSYTERRNMMTWSGCFTCLGRDQGCSSGT